MWQTCFAENNNSKMFSYAIAIRKSSSVGGCFVTLESTVFPLSVVHSRSKLQTKQEYGAVVLGYFEIRSAAENKEEYILSVGGLALIMIWRITFHSSFKERDYSFSHSVALL